MCSEWGGIGERVSKPAYGELCWRGSSVGFKTIWNSPLEYEFDLSVTSTLTLVIAQLTSWQLVWVRLPLTEPLSFDHAGTPDISSLIFADPRAQAVRYYRQHCALLSLLERCQWRIKHCLLQTPEELIFCETYSTSFLVGMAIYNLWGILSFKLLNSHCILQKWALFPVYLSPGPVAGSLACNIQLQLVLSHQLCGQKYHMAHEL